MKDLLNFIQWYDWKYVNDDDPNMKIDSFFNLVKERYELANNDYSKAYYILADIFEEYLKYLENYKKITCEYCENIDNNLNAFSGCEGIILDAKTKKYNLVTEYFKNEINKVEINYCPWCSRKL